VQALVRWDPAGHARRELADRAALALPPAARLAAVTGPPEAVGRLLSSAELPAGARLLGPVELPTAPPGRPRRADEPPPGERWQRLLIGVPPAGGAALSATLRAARAARLAHGDPTDIG
jgi:primosomal protein N' (replication factor Y)